ncbi:MAG TPA: flagellar biosynthesis protein FliQ [Bacillota bacterium]|nr:flagellar biosynthesis protein FliQ [Bacillota bacterium]
MLLRVTQETLRTVLLIAGPVLAASLLVGLAVSLVQAATQIQEQTLTFVPKLLAVGITLALFGPWMLRTLVEFCRNLFLTLPGVSF